MCANRLLAWRPDADMERLLRAVILEDDRWKDEWRRWRGAADLDRLAPGAFRLMPLAYRRLKTAGIGDPWMGRMQGIYRHTWARNRLLLRDAAQAARTLDAAGIPVMAIKGAAMILSQYRDAGLCPAVDVDVLVPDGSVLEAIGLLREAGFSATGRYEGDLPERFVRIGFSHAFRSPAGGELDLHWHMLYFRSFAGADEVFWRHAEPFEMEGASIRLPSPTDMLLQSCLHGLCWSSTSSVRWVADSARLIRDGSIEWDRLAEYTAWPGVALPLGMALAYLRDSMEVNIPADSIRRISSARVTNGDRWVTQTYAGKESLFWNASSIWLRYARFSREKPASLPALLAGLPGFLTAYWALPSLRQVPVTAIRKIARRIPAPGRGSEEGPGHLDRSIRN